MSRVYNFGPGPATVPESVLNKAREELPEWHSSGMSVIEMSHRGKDFAGIAEQAEAVLRELLEIPASYRVLFLQGGATGQFAAVPLNLKRDKTRFAYLSTGLWSEKAIAEAKRYGEVQIVASSKEQGYTTIPSRSDWNIDPEAAYLHYTANETIGGVEFQSIPEVENLTLVADMSSNILSRPVNVSRFGVIYAGALTYNNISRAGLDKFPSYGYRFASQIENPDAILLRSFDLHNKPIPESLKAVGRAGAGVNNIPVADYTKRGIPVFNAPGANSNAVAELAIAGMLLASRNIPAALNFVKTLDGDDESINSQIELERIRSIDGVLSVRVI